MLPVDRAVTDPARVDVPALLAEVRSLRAERDALRKVDDAMVDRALNAFYYRAPGMVSDGLARQQMRAALDAALVVQP